ncbi:MAG TPA: O-antigen ligase family protein, partial [Brevefilum fermentans]|nr:O-antigen ligase family protein [Brevefilum fermentans]
MNNLKYQLQSSLPQLSAHPRFGPISKSIKILLMVLLHILLALTMRSYKLVSTLHAMVVLAIGVYTALTSEDIKKIIPIIGYITGAEVLWRMTKAGVFWEFGKYATIAILILALLKMGKIKRAGLPLLFFIVLIPSVALTVGAFGWSERARELISFNLSGPLATSVCILFFSQIKAALNENKNWVWPTVYPIIGVLTLAIFSTITATTINFGGESVFVTSGGFGPNQVSAVLGLGALLLVLLTVTDDQREGRFLAMGLALVLLVQSFLTFSRGGLYNFAIALIISIFHLLAKPNRFVRSIFTLSLLLLLMIAFILPQLEQLTGGMLSKRFSDTDVSSRKALVKADFQIFSENPTFGVGPGMAMYFRRGTVFAAAHTEFSRILAEHGSGGVLALFILMLLLLR